MRTPLLAALASVLSFSGCTSTPVLLPPAAKLRDNLGRVAVVAHTNSKRIAFQVPQSRADVSAEAQSFELITPRMIVADARGISDGATAAAVGAVALTTPVLMMGGAPIAQEVRRAYGLVVADSSAAVGAARTTMDSVVARIRFEQQLRDQLIADLPPAAPSVTLAESPRAADTLLELMVYEPSVSGREGINPGLRLCLGLRVRLIDARSGREVYYDYLDYRGTKRTLVAWAANDARLLREEIDRCIALLSREIIAQILTRPTNEVADRATLAALGLERRPPVPGTPGWSLPRTTNTIARN